MSKQKKNTAPTMLAALYFLLITSCWNSFITSAHAISKVHIVYMGEKAAAEPTLITDSHLDLLASVVGSKEKAANSLIYSYRHGFSGFAAKLTEDEAEKMSELPGVISVMHNHFHYIQSTRSSSAGSWDYLGLSTHAPSNNLLQKANEGDGIIIGIIDTGVWPEAKIFNDEGLGPVPARWKGRCDSGPLFNATKHCNRKLVGAKWFIDGLLAENDQPINITAGGDYLSPVDAIGHGTSMTSIAAGSKTRVLTKKYSAFRGLGPGVVRGGAPRARIASYKALWSTETVIGTGSYADVLKAIDEAIHDGVDLLSISIGSPFPPVPEVDVRDGIAVGSFHAVMKGIPVICSGGNSGPASFSLTNQAPWIVNVAATTIDQSFPTPLTLGNNETILGQGIFTGKETSFTSLVYPQNPAGPTPTAAGFCESLILNHTSVKGKVVLCFTNPASGSGAAAWSVSLINAVTAVRGAGGVGLIAATPHQNILQPSKDDFPFVVVDYELGTKILSYILSTRSPTIRIRPSTTLLGKPVATKVATFSSRGPNAIAPAILKPDIAAPGVSILVETSPLDLSGDGRFGLSSGTSPAAPHVAAIVALLKVVYPTWSPAALRSAIVTTAWKTDPLGEPIFAEGNPRKLANPFDYGAGLVNPNRAAEPGIVYDMGVDDYIHYLCAMNYNASSISLLVGQATSCPRTKPSILDVNLPSITIPNLGKSVTLTRTVTNVGPPNSIYKAYIDPPLGINVIVRPNLLVFNSTRKTLSFKVTVSTSHRVNTGYYFGSLSWTDGLHTATSSISVRTQIIQSYTDDN